MSLCLFLIFSIEFILCSFYGNIIFVFLDVFFANVAIAAVKYISLQLKMIILKKNQIILTVPLAKKLSPKNNHHHTNHNTHSRDSE